jgi:protocatechuate 3,4-dioxygenase beta subunit
MWKVAVGAPGYLTMEYRLIPLVDARELPALELMPADELEVRLADAEGAPRPGAVGAYALGFRGDAWLPRLRLARAGDDGVARLPLGRDEKIHLEVLADGHPLRLAQVAGERSVRIELNAGVRRTVRVTDSRKRPLPEAVAFQGSGLLPLGLADAEGRISLVLAPESAGAASAPTLRVATADRWHGAFELDLGDGGEEDAPVEELRLAPPATFRGRVLDLSSRDPVPGALVWEVRGEPAVTDARGRYTLELGAYRSYRRVQAAAAGYQRGYGERQGSSGDGPTIALAPAAGLSGRVVDGEGNPLPGVALELSAVPVSGRFGSAAHLRDRSRATSSRNGAFSLSGLAAGVFYRIRFTKAGFAPLELRVEPLEPFEQRSGVEVVLRPGRLGVGRVVDESDAPIAGAEVTLRSAQPTDPMTAAIQFARRGGDEAEEPTAATDAEGRFEIADLAAGRYDLEVRAGGFAPAKVPGVKVGEGGGQVDLGTVVLAPGASIEGRVADPDGRAIASAEVTVRAGRDGLLGWSGAAGPRAKVQTDAGGRFVVADLAPGQPVVLTVAKEGYGTEATSSLRPPADGVAVVLRPAGRLRGRVVDARGRPIEGARVMAYPDDRPVLSAERMLARQQRPSWAVSGADGRFLIEDVEPGTLRVAAEAESFQQASLSGLELAAGGEREIEIVLETGAVVEGRVTTADGVPVVSASVGVTPRRDLGMSGSLVSSGNSSGATDAEGRYRVEGAAVGPASITVYYDGRPRLNKSVEVRPGDNVFDLVLERGFEVSGQVVGADGTGVAGAVLDLQAAPRPGFSAFSHGGMSAQAVSRGDGTFTLTNVAAGRYKVTASREGFAAASSEVFEVDDDVAGLLLELGRGATLKGRLLGLEPDELGTLALFASGETGFRRGEVGPSARYAFTGLTPGRWHVQAEVSSSGRMAILQVEIAEGVTEVSEDIDFGGGFTLSGVVLDGGEPLAGAGVVAAGSMTNVGRASTDAEGRFRIEHLKAGSVQVMVMVGTQVEHSERLELAGDHEMRIELLTGGVSGTLRDAAGGEPVAGARVVLESLDAGEGSLQSLLSRYAGQIESDSRGYFHVPRVRPGRWRLVATKEGYAPGEAVVEVAGGSPTEVEIPMTPTEGVTFEVVLESGFHLRTVQVTILDPSGRRLAGGLYPVVDGRVRVATVPPGLWELVVQGGDGAATRFPVSSPGDQGRFVLPTAGMLHLRVPELETEMVASVVLTGPDGKPLIPVSGTAWGPVGDRWPMRLGQATISGLAPGVWSFTVQHPDGRAWSGSATVAPGAATEVSLP